MKGLYICAGQDFSDKASGISKKIMMQVKSFENAGFDISIINIDNKSGQNIFENIKFVLPFTLSKYEKRIINLQNTIIDWKNINFVYIRKIAFCRGFEYLLRNIKYHNKKIIVILELPTYPFKNEYSNIKMILGCMAEYYSKKLYKYVDYIVTYSKDSEIYGIPALSISNGVDVYNIKARTEANINQINMIAVALFSKWHGYDRLIEGLNNYYNRNILTQDIHLYLVGSGEYLNKYEELVNKYGLKNVIHILGAKYGDEIDKIYNKCNIAIDALGRHRSGVYYNSSLKGKEYAAKGLPIVSGVETEFDLFDDYKYYLRVPADDTPIDIDRIIEFYQKVSNNEPENVVINNIRNFCKNNFSFIKTFNPVIEVIKENAK